MTNADYGNQAAFAAGAESWNQAGLSKREYFAAMAMQGLCVRQFQNSEERKPFIEWCSALSVELSDELITALNENSSTQNQ